MSAETKRRCSAENKTFDTLCTLDAGHEGKHKSEPFVVSVEWPDDESKSAITWTAVTKGAGR